MPARVALQVEKKIRRSCDLLDRPASRLRGLPTKPPDLTDWTLNEWEQDLYDS